MVQIKAIEKDDLIQARDEEMLRLEFLKLQNQIRFLGLLGNAEFKTGGKKKAVLQEHVVCETNRDPSGTTNPAGGLSLRSSWSCDQ